MTDVSTSAVPGGAATPAEAMTAWIVQTVAENPVVLFMKGVPDEPRCGFSATVVQILDHLGVEFAGVDVLASNELRDQIKAFSDWPTIPQLYVKGEFVGGCDIIRQMFQAGELKPFLTEQGVLAG